MQLFFVLFYYDISTLVTLHDNTTAKQKVKKKNAILVFLVFSLG